MSSLYEFTLDLGPSFFYRRLVISLSLLSVGLVVYCSAPFFLKIILSVFILILMFQPPQLPILKIQWINQQWLVFFNEKALLYNEAKLLFYNPFFQLLAFSNDSRKKVILLFNDQASIEKFRIFHFQLHRQMALMRNGGKNVQDKHNHKDKKINN